ncbi:MAG: UDP-N-acetylmuramate dehydrogenase, partial [Parasporobacterium sp.]|nr:UDP-N-acetylmuramate dehydrogenase [Parasporobacterium sp.]
MISTGRYIVLEAVFELEKGDKAAIDEKIAELTFKRESSQPLELPSCGSTFKRPEGYFTGKLVMDAGLRGARVGGASVSEKHCGFVVNDKHGTAADVLGVIELVKKTVLEKYGVELQCEVKII